MSWARLDDGATEHLKVRRAGTAGMALWTAGIVWSSRHLTDGHIPRDMLADLWRPVGEAFDAEGAAKRLVDLGLWVEVADGWEIHDYLDYNMSADEVRRRRDLATERQRKRRTRNISDSEPDGRVTQVVTRDIQRDSHATSRVSHATPTRPDPTRPDPSTDTQRERPRGRVASSLPELPDPLSEHDTVSSEEYPWRAFRAKGAELGLVVEPRPSMKDRGHAQSIEHAALHAASLAHERMGFDVEGAYVRLVWLAMTEYAKRRAARPERNPWKLGFVASAWAELTAGAIPAEAAE